MSSTHYTLYAYSPAPSTHLSLPFLDPSALYAAKLLEASGVCFGIAPPDTWRHTDLPRLERDGKLIAAGTEEILSFCQKRRARWEKSGDTGSIESSAALSAEIQPALSSYLSSHLEPLVYSVLFPSTLASTDVASSSSSGFSDVYSNVTFPAYSAGLGFYAKRIIPHRLTGRAHGLLQVGDSEIGKVLMSEVGEWGTSAEKNASAADEERRKTTQEGMKRLDGSDTRRFTFGKAKQTFKQKFLREKVIVAAQRTFDPIVSSLELLSTQSRADVSALHLYLFSLLAPLLLFTDPTTISPEASDFNSKTSKGLRALASHPVVELLREQDRYAPIRQWMNELSVLIGVDRTPPSHTEQGDRWTGITFGDAVASNAIDQIPEQPAEDTVIYENNRRFQTGYIEPSAPPPTWLSQLSPYIPFYYPTSSSSLPSPLAPSELHQPKEDPIPTTSERELAKRLTVGRAAVGVAAVGAICISTAFRTRRLLTPWISGRRSTGFTNT